MSLPDTITDGVQVGQDRWAGRAQPAPTVPQLSLDQYVALLGDVPLPTEQQRANFVDHVAHLHSWYKHMTPTPLGAVPFYFYLDPAACSGVAEFHHNYVPAGEYRECFGCLDYCGRAGTTVRMASGEPRGFNRERYALLRGLDGELWDLPAEVDEAGTTYLTASMHTWTAMWMDFWPVRQWPNESGGQAALDQMLARAAQLYTYSGRLIVSAPVRPPECHLRADEMAGALPQMAKELPDVDAELYRLFAPEQRRQHALMRAAIDRVCALIEAHRQGQAPRP